VARLYDLDVLAANEVPVAAVVYHEDMYVEHAFSAETAGRVGNLRWWATSEPGTTGCAATTGPGPAARPHRRRPLTAAWQIGQMLPSGRSSSVAADCWAPARSGCCRPCSKQDRARHRVGTSIGAINGAAVAADPNVRRTAARRVALSGGPGLYSGGALGRVGHFARVRTSVHLVSRYAPC
jgi:hypothetical protein